MTKKALVNLFAKANPDIKTIIMLKAYFGVLRNLVRNINQTTASNNDKVSGAIETVQFKTPEEKISKNAITTKAFDFVIPSTSFKNINKVIPVTAS
jgi:hypothetical protein